MMAATGVQVLHGLSADFVLTHGVVTSSITADSSRDISTTRRNSEIKIT